MRKRKTAAATKMAGTAARPTDAKMKSEISATVGEIVPVRTETFTGGDFVKLLRSLPHPGKEYLDAVERHVRKQTKAEKSKWRKSRASKL
jgi:hypothetical protein